MLVRSGGRRVLPLQVLRIPAFRRMWLASMLLAFAQWLDRLAIGWLILDRTGSPLLTALSFAVRMAPALLVGPIAGAVADRVPRAALMIATSATRGLVLLALALLVFSGADHIALVLLLVSLSGASKIFEVPAEQALIVDLVGRERNTAAVGLHSLGVRGMGMVGALAGGVLVDAAGVGAALIAGAGVVAPAVILLAFVRVADRAAPARRVSLRVDVIDGVRVLLQMPVVTALLLFAIGVEVMGFAFNSLVPTLAVEGLGVAASGLGVPTLSVGVGAIAGSLLLSLLRGTRGRSLLTVAVAYGLLLFAVALTDRFALAALALAGVGAAAVMFDAMQWVLLQAQVPDEMRGRALGGWVWAIGWGWLGPVILGSVAEVWGIRAAFAAGGASVLAITLLAVVFVPRLRRL